jgi:hypothetical protein
MVVFQVLGGSGRARAFDTTQWHMQITPKEGDEKVPQFSLVEPAEVEHAEFKDTKPAGRPVEERGPEY